MLPICDTIVLNLLRRSARRNGEVIMELTVLGKYGPFPPAGGKTSGYLLTIGEKKILLDCGEGVFSALRGVIDPCTLDCVVLSHFHYDHASDLGVFNYYLENRAKTGEPKKIVLFHPEDDSPLAAAICALPWLIPVCVKDGTTERRKGVDLSFFAMKHPVPAVGVRISCGKETFAYSGDTNVTDRLISLLTGADLAVLDGAFSEKDGSSQKPHMSIADCGEYAKKCCVKSIISHFLPTYNEEEIVREIEKQGCIPAEEGKTYRV